jgi:thiamine biosynthesis lipoprotein
MRQHRLLDPRSGEPARKARSVTVLGGDALTAKCLARAIFVLGAKDGLSLAARHKGVEVVVVDQKNVVHLSPGLKKLAASGGLHQRPPTDAP